MKRVGAGSRLRAPRAAARHRLGDAAQWRGPGRHTRRYSTSLSAWVWMWVATAEKASAIPAPLVLKK